MCTHVQVSVLFQLNVLYDEMLLFTVLQFFLLLLKHNFKSKALFVKTTHNSSDLLQTPFKTL